MNNKLPYNHTNTTILRVDIPFSDFSKTTGNEAHDAAFILEDINGDVAAIEFFHLMAFCNWYSEGLSVDSSEYYDHILKEAIPSNEEGIEIFLDDADLLFHFEEFRCSQFHQHSFIKLA